MNKTYQVVPWFNSKEWCDVYDKIYSDQDGIQDRKQALNILHVWKARCPSLPSGIESTSCLLEVYIQDLDDIYSTNNEQLLRLAYATALMRFVNHMLDKETRKGLSLYNAANLLGVPDWIVDLRHDTAHSNKLPPLHLLREASSVSLDWLKCHYWDNYKEGICDYLVSNNNDCAIKENKTAALLNFCTSLSIFSHSKCDIKNLAQIPDASMKESLVNDATELFGNSVDFSNLKTVSITGLSNLMYMEAKKLLTSESAIYINKTLLSEDSLILSLEVYNVFDSGSKKNRKKLSKPYVQCFEGLLYFLHTHDLLKDFIIELINLTHNNDENSNKCQLAAQWVSIILQALKKCQQFHDQMKKNQSINTRNLVSKDEEELKSLYYHWYPNDKNNSLLLNLTKSLPKDLTNIKKIQPIVSSYNPYLVYFVKDLLALVKPCIPVEICNKIYKLAELIAFPERFSVVSSKIYTVEDVKIESENLSDSSDVKEINDVEIIENMEIEEIHGENESVWQIAEKTHAWSTTPIGSLPWCNIAIQQ